MTPKKAEARQLKKVNGTQNSGHIGILMKKILSDGRELVLEELDVDPLEVATDLRLILRDVLSGEEQKHGFVESIYAGMYAEYLNQDEYRRLFKSILSSDNFYESSVQFEEEIKEKLKNSPKLEIDY
jgi:hypothetical protein